jgi:hypothetical protein
MTIRIACSVAVTLTSVRTASKGILQMGSITPQ